MAGRHRRVRSTAPGRHRKPPRRGHLVLPSLAVAAVLGIGGVGAGAALGGGGHPAARVPRPVAPTAQPASPKPPQPARPPSSPPAAPATVAPAPLPGFAVTVTGKLAWVQVFGPRGQVLYAGLLRHGHTLTYPQRPLTVVLGDAGAVRLVLRGHAYAPAGKPGEVLRFTVR